MNNIASEKFYIVISSKQSLITLLLFTIIAIPLNSSQTTTIITFLCYFGFLCNCFTRILSSAFPVEFQAERTTKKENTTRNYLFEYLRNHQFHRHEEWGVETAIARLNKRGKIIDTKKPRFTITKK